MFGDRHTAKYLHVRLLNLTVHRLNCQLPERLMDELRDNEVLLVAHKAEAS